MDRSSVQGWLDRYVAAWKSYDRAEIESLFASEATYRYHPYDAEDEIVRGRDAIVSDWVEPDGAASTRDAPGTYDARYEPYAVDGDRAVVTGASTLLRERSGRPHLRQRLHASLRRRGALHRVHRVVHAAPVT